MVGQCKLCGQLKQLIKAHIIPRQYYRRIRHDQPHLLQYAISEQEFMGFTQSGLYESDLLCADCDRLLGQYDDYGYKVLPSEIDDSKILSHRRIKQALYALGKIDVQKFRKFLVALAWRAGIAKHQMFKLVQLGPYEARLKDILLGSRAHLDSISAVIILFRPPDYPDILWSPFTGRVGSVNSSVFYLPPWKLELKLDKRPFEYPYANWEVREGADTFAIIQDFWSEGELAVLRDAQQAIRNASPNRFVPEGTKTR